MDFANSWPNYVHLCLYTLLIILPSLLLPSASVATNVSCLPDQSSSLLQLKRGFYSDLTSWQPGTDCCHGWEGVSCDEATGHVTSLDINGHYIQGNLSAAICNLTSLQHLDLANNEFSHHIPDCIAELPLKELQLWGCNFEGLFPHEIFQIPTLTKLGLFGNLELFGSLPNFSIVSSLESLVLANTNFFGSIPDSIGNLRNLSELSLSNCNFSGEIPSSIEKLDKLATLDLSYNSHSGSIPPSLFSLPNLENLYLHHNNLSGQFRLKESSFIFSPLIRIALSENQLNGPIPWHIFKFSNLKTLGLSRNQFNGPILNSIVWLSSLCILSLNSNNFNGTFDLNLLGHLSNLTYLSLSDNQLSVEEVLDEPLPLAFPQINIISLASCNLSQIPRLLRFVGDLDYVDLSKNQLHGAIPRWICAPGATLNLSHNMFTSVEDVPPDFSFNRIDFSFNKLKGAVPLVGAEFLDYSNNEFSEIPSNYTLHLKQTSFLSLSRNMLTGEIPSSICELSLTILDLSYNNFNGSIPACIIGNPVTRILRLRGNQFSGILSHHIDRSCALVILDLNNNNLEGYLPRSFKRCKELALLDIGNNLLG